MKRLGLLVLLLLAGWWASTAAFQVDETEYAIVTQFGRPVRTIMEAGLQFKWPAPVQSVLRFDRRLQVFETPLTTRDAGTAAGDAGDTRGGSAAADSPAAGRLGDEFLTRDKKNVVVGTYTAWRIAPTPETLARFLETVRDQPRAEVRLADLIVSELGAALGQHPFSAFVTNKPDEWRWPQLVKDIGERCRQRALSDYGIEVVDFQIDRLGFPEQNRRSVFERMRAERERIASQYRAEGDTEARKIRSDAELEANRIRVEADEKHLKILGEADAEATGIYGRAYGEDPEFYEFVRSLETWAGAFDQNTVTVFSAANRFLKPLFENLDANAAAPAASRPASPPAQVDAAGGGATN